jgi:hypothetical protein
MLLPLLAGLAVLILLLLLLRGFAFADVKRLARNLRMTAALLLGVAALGLAVTGRFAMALVAGGIAWALLMGRPITLPPPGGPQPGNTPRPPPRGGMSRAEALKVLGLEECASADEIRAAHRRLIMQAHPDRGGSTYLASKINEAKDVLLDE